MDEQSQTDRQTPLLAASRPGIHLLAAHPNWRESRVNRRARDAVSALTEVQACDLYQRYPDYCIDLTAEQARLADASLVVLMDPIQWYSMPALQKLWLDENRQRPCWTMMPR